MKTIENLIGFQYLTPDTILDSIESQGYRCNSQLLALNSYENRVYQIGIEDAPALIAKFYRPQRWTDQAILEEHELTLALAQDEIPVVAPLVNAKGKTLHHYGHYRFSLYPQKGGRTPELDNPQQLEVIGRFLARIHLYGEQRPFKYRPTLDIEHFGINPSQYLLKQHLIPFELESVYASLIKDLIPKIEYKFELAGQVNFIRLHGDCHPSNILWREGIPHIVDFDDARMGAAIQDLWMFLSGDYHYQAARLNDVLKGYAQFRDFNPRELHLIEALRTLRMIHYAAWLAKRAEDPAFKLAFPWFYSPRYWDDHILSLREQSALLEQETLVL